MFIEKNQSQLTNSTEFVDQNTNKDDDDDDIVKN